MKERLVWIDMARGISMFCVLLAHSNVNHYYLHMFYSPWFLVLFFFISGYLYNPTSLKSDIKKLFRSLVVPYFLLSFLLFLIGLDNWKAILGGNWNFLALKIQDIILGRHLWFIPCIIMVQFYYIVLYHLFMKTIISKIIIAIILFSSVYFIRNVHYYVAPYCFDIAIFACSYFIVGGLIKQCSYFDFFLYLERKLACVRSMLYVLISICGYFCLVLFLNTHFNMEFHFAYNYYESPFCFLLLSLIGMGVINFVAINYSSWFLQNLGKNSLLVFAFNGKAYAIFNYLYDSFGMSINTYLYCILLSVSEGLFLIIIAFVINKYAPCLTGRHKSQH